MSAETKAADKLFVAKDARHAFVRVVGRGSFKVSPALKEFATATLVGDCAELVLDMKDCIGMDSTFMGVLAGIALRLRARNGRVVMVNLASRTRGLLATLGLDQVVTPYLTGEVPADLAALLSDAASLAALEDRERSTQETAQTMLEAHQNLVELSPDNLPKFKDVLAFLREDLKRSEKGGS